MRGDHIKVFRYFYYHHAIDMGDGSCVHFTGEPFKKFDSYIQRTDMNIFLKGGNQKTVVYSECKETDEVVNTALSYVGQAGYHLVWNNCYHFARYCKTGIPMPLKFHQLNEKAASFTGFSPLMVGPPLRCQPEMNANSFSAQLHNAVVSLKDLNKSIINIIVHGFKF